MYENKYKNPSIAKIENLENFLNLIADLDEPLELFAIGGTAMVLKNIKESTKDIDFLTSESYGKIKRMLSLAGLKEESSSKMCNVWRLGEIRIDIFYDGFVMGIKFPDDWREISEKVKDIGKVKLYILNWYDLIITKISRSETRDIEDIENFITYIPSLMKFSNGKLPKKRDINHAIHHIIAIIKSQKIDFNFLKKRYYFIAETALISDYDYKFKHLEREYAKRKTN